MRELKFRLVKDNKLQGVVELKAPNGIIDVAYQWDTAYQFTGLLDKNGREIYEGDVIAERLEVSEDSWGKGWKVTVSPTGKIVWLPGGSCFTCEQIKEGLVFRDNGEKSLLHITVDPYDGYTIGEAIKTWEIIGNIYENPELLK